MPIFLLCSATTNLEKSFSSTGNVTACTYIVYPIVLLLCISQTVHCESDTLEHSTSLCKVYADNMEKFQHVFSEKSLRGELCNV